MVTQFTHAVAVTLHPEHGEVYLASEEEDERELVCLACRKVSDEAFQWLNLPTAVYIDLRKDSNEASEQFVVWIAGNLWRCECFVDNVTGLLIGAECSAQETLSGVLAMFMTRVKPKAINKALFINPFARNVGNTAQIHSWWYDIIARIDPAKRNSPPPCPYVSVLDESSQWLWSSLIFGIGLLRRLLAPVQQWHTAARPQLTHFQILNNVALRDPKHGCLGIGLGQVHMPRKCSWGKFKVPVLFNRCLDNQFRSASFDLHWPILEIFFTTHTSMAYDK